ncbi:MSCRAMM family protein [Edaphobacter bradus]|uniref:MSCRAMM family protein n=1 Tax=Edaphobacter bradus TaxID=2259016 RepID=UPI0021DFB4D2|nr:carboxypeptidase-like regulatory domain-containing protein [Edaphobacter bradus]
MFHCSEIRAQESAGQAEVAIQGYYLTGSGQPLTETSGIAENSTQFIKGLGLITTNVEGYGGDGFRAGSLFMGLQGAPIWGWHWDFLGGDFHFSSYLVENPFSNVYTPEIAGRGVQIAMRRTDRTYQFFAGEDTVLEGPRIPFRFILPQRVIGASMQQKVGTRLAFGVRFLNLETNPSALIKDPTYFSPGHSFQSSNSVTVQSTYRFSEHLKFYGEAGYGRASSFTPSLVGQQPFSLLIGPSWETSKFSIRANYVRQSTSYMPLLGYFAGDRKGPYVEGHYRPLGRVELYGSASAYANNLENNPHVPSFTSSGYTAGASFTLPWKFSAGASLTSLRLTELDPSQPIALPSNNLQISLTVSRPLRRHNLRFSLIDMKLNTNSLPQSQRFEEIEDTFTWKHLVLGGATRLQSSQSSTQNLNTLFFRGSIQANIKKISVYGYVEKGNDLVNQSVFSTNSVSSTVVGLSAPLFNGWSLHFEAFKNQLLTSLNPANIFLFGNSDQGLNTQLADFNQRSIYFRISKRYSWGKALDQGSTMQQYAAAQAPLVGSIQGFVMEAALAGARPAPNVTIILDHNRTAVSDTTGRYAFADVPEGLHQVELNMEELPADYAPGPADVAHVSVVPRTIARTDFDVLRLANLTGKIVAPKDVQIGNVVLRLVGTKLYTTPYGDGTFSFYNLGEGRYEVEIDVQTLPEGYILASPARMAVVASSTGPASTIGFELKIKPQAQKPVREILKQEIHVNTPGSSTPRH